MIHFLKIVIFQVKTVSKTNHTQCDSQNFPQENQEFFWKCLILYIKGIILGSIFGLFRIHPNPRSPDILGFPIFHYLKKWDKLRVKLLPVSLIISLCFFIKNGFAEANAMTL